MLSNETELVVLCERVTLRYTTTYPILALFPVHHNLPNSGPLPKSHTAFSMSGTDYRPVWHAYRHILCGGRPFDLARQMKSNPHVGRGSAEGSWDTPRSAT